jgi:hypothetical protein
MRECHNNGAELAARVCSVCGCGCESVRVWGWAVRVRQGEHIRDVYTRQHRCSQRSPNRLTS